MPEHTEGPRLRPVEAFPAEVEEREVVCLRDPSGVTDAVLSVPRSLAPILALFDGRSLVDVQAQIMRQSGELVLRSLREIAASHPGERVLVVAHGGPLRAVLRHCEVEWQRPIANCEVARIEIEDGELRSVD